MDLEREGGADLEIEKELAEVIDDVAAGREDGMNNCHLYINYMRGIYFI